jgi:predicted ArsR family transcriptional regulator
MMTNKEPTPLPLLSRREIEARLAAPLLAALGEAFGREQVLTVAQRVIQDIARQQGAQLAASLGGCTLAHFAASLEAWKKDDALEMDVLERSNERFSFNVTHCRYAEMYKELGIPELGTLLSCNRDFALAQGFNPEIVLTRTQTIMEGALFCDFRYTLMT